MRFAEKLKKRLEAAIKAKRDFLENADKMETFDKIAEVVVSAYKNGGRLYIAGNGGSAADAQHLAAEFVSRLAKDRNPLPAEALTVDSSIITAIGNDYGFDKIFSRQIEGKMRPGDLFLGITTSGASANINNALKACGEKGFTTIVFCGRDGGEAGALADYCLIADGGETGVIQELHLALEHALCACVEEELFGA